MLCYKTVHIIKQRLKFIYSEKATKCCDLLRIYEHYHHNNHAAGADLPVMGLEQAVHRLEKSSPKHSAQ
jgi:hypothetical protein